MRKIMTNSLKAVLLAAFALVCAFSMSAQTHLVTFNMLGHGEQVEAQYVEHGGVVTVPTPQPSEQGYSFEGWYPEAERINLYDFSTPVTDDIILYAGWSKVTRPVKPSDDGYSTPEMYNADKKNGNRLYPVTSGEIIKDVFMGNDFIELGIHRNGAFGSNSEGPVNFHAWECKVGYKIGLRASKSGWETDDDPQGTFTRDFFTPGSIDEGWLITTDGSDFIRGQHGCEYDFSGLNLSSSVMSYKRITDPVSGEESQVVKVVVQTTVNFEITQIVRMSKTDTGYDTWVIIKNNSTEDKADMCYFRAFDPDQPGSTGPQDEESYTTDNFYHTEANGDVYVMAASNNTELPEITTIDDFFKESQGAFFFYAPLWDYGYTVKPKTQGVGWNTFNNFKDVDNDYHEFEDTGMSICIELGTIKAGESKELYYYSSLDPDSQRALEKLKTKIGVNYPSPYFTSENVIDDVIKYEPGSENVTFTLKEDTVTGGRMYLANKKCSSMSDLAKAANQLVRGKATNGEGVTEFTVPSVEGGPYYAYYVSEDGIVSAAREFYIAPGAITYRSITYHANGGVFNDYPGEETQVRSQVHWTYTVDPEFKMSKPSANNIPLEGWYTNAECTVPFVFGGRLEDDTDLYAKYGVNITYNVGTCDKGYTIIEGYAADDCDNWSDESNMFVKMADEDRYDFPNCQTLDYHTFKGWYIEDTFETKVENGDEMTDFNNDTLYAKWAKDPDYWRKVTYTSTEGGTMAIYSYNLERTYPSGDSLYYCGDYYAVATPAEHYGFEKFVVTGYNAGEYPYNPLYFYPYGGDMHFVAYFEGVPCEITVTSNDETLGTVDGGDTYHYGDDVTLTATPTIAQYQFLGWALASAPTTIISTENPYVFKANSDADYVGVFVDEVSVNIEASPAHGGTVIIKDANGDILDEDARQHLTYGATVTIKAIPTEGYAFQGWFNKVTGEYFSKTQTYTFDATTPKLELEARFTDQVIWVRVKK